jgi:hypothetical protein
VAANDRIIATVDDLHRLLSGRATVPTAAPPTVEAHGNEFEISVIRDDRIQKFPVTPRVAGRNEG